MTRVPEKSEVTVERALSRMELIRAFEERLLELFSEGKLSGTTHTCIGQEVCAFGVLEAIDRDRDIVFSNHRCHGHFLIYGDNVDGLIAEIMGRETGVCGGRGGSQHLCERNFYSNGIQGGIVPVATGMALAEKLKNSGAVAICFIGDGTLGQGAVYESLNMASLWDVPIIYVLEHNRYAQSTATARTTSGDVVARAEAFGIEAHRQLASDPIQVTEHMSEIIADVRQRPRPFFQVLDTERLAAHSKGDDDRSGSELDSIRASDPLMALRERVGEEQSRSSQAAARDRIDIAVARAEAAAPARLEVGGDSYGYATEPAASTAPAAAFASSDDTNAPLVVQNLNRALHMIMTKCHESVLIGEDLIDPYGGAFKVSRGLSTKFPDRVLSTPISEAGFVGLSTGMSVRGFKPIVEIMFGDFLTLAADQIVNHLGKFRWMYNDQIETPVVIRTPVGGRRGYGPTHSQSLEKIFCGVPGIVTVAISRRHDPGELLRRAVMDDPRPVLFIEQKILYPRPLETRPLPGTFLDHHHSETEALYPTGVWRTSADTPADVTVVTYGAMTDMVEDAILRSFEEDEVICEYLVPSQLSPLRIEPVTDSVRRTGRLLVVEEGTGPWGFGSELVARICEEEPGTRVGRVAARQLPIPNARSAEDQMLPNIDQIVQAIGNLLA
jgi:2-oxoisovalerate dehydrogenase E1 component